MMEDFSTQALEQTANACKELLKTRAQHGDRFFTHRLPEKDDAATEKDLVETKAGLKHYKDVKTSEAWARVRDS
jgi:hypothetical protein